MAKPKLTDEQKRAKNLKEAKRNQRFFLILFAFSLFLLSVTLRAWYLKPGVPSALDVVMVCGVLLGAAFGRADAKETIRRGGEKYESLAGQWSLILAVTCHFLKETALPISLWWCILAVYAVVTTALFGYFMGRGRFLRHAKTALR